ncbi:MAG: transcriptional regulator, AraC family [Bryobacterales bacterium]|nr:transcriptional regulator, AraC family [Bryobacterales bacterium]
MASAAALITAGQIPPRDRIDAIRDAVWSSVVRIEIDHKVPSEAIDTKIKVAQLGGVGLCSVSSTSATVRRTSRLARADEEPAVFLALELSASGVIVQDGREALIRPGQFAIFDTSTPYTLLFPGRIDQHYFRIPAAALGLSRKALRDSTAIAFGTGDPVGELAAMYFAKLASPEMSRDHYSAAVIEPALHLIRAAISTRLGNDAPAEGSGSILGLRIMAYLRAHLSDPGLRASQVAAAHHISVRYLYAVLEREGVSLREWIVQRRLDECHKDLADAHQRSTTISEISHRWGFVDDAHFSKRFRLAYGITPRDWRALSRFGSMLATTVDETPFGVLAP